MTVVAHANGRRYFASSDGAYVEVPIEIAGSHELLRRRVRLHVGTKVKTMSEARICCYGQKWKKMLVVDEKFYRALGTNGRFYNLAGNPMMVKVAEGQLDAVFEVGGQKPYDVVPGAYIAMKAGAVLLTPEGGILTEDDLYKACLVPNSELRYILAGTKELADELQSYLVTAKTLGEKPNDR